MEKPSMELWLKEAKAAESAGKVGMYLFHLGVVRESPKALVRQGDSSKPPVKAMSFDYDPIKVETALEQARRMEGIFHVRAWLNKGELALGDDIMQVLIGGDIRPHVTACLDFLVGKLKNECVSEKEIY